MNYNLFPFIKKRKCCSLLYPMETLPAKQTKLCVVSTLLQLRKQWGIWFVQQASGSSGCCDKYYPIHVLHAFNLCRWFFLSPPESITVVDIVSPIVNFKLGLLFSKLSIKCKVITASDTKYNFKIIVNQIPKIPTCSWSIIILTKTNCG